MKEKEDRIENNHPHAPDAQETSIRPEVLHFDTDIIFQPHAQPLRGYKPDFNRFPLGGPLIGGAAGDRITFPPNKGGKHHYTIAQLSEITGYHPVYLRRLLIDGKIEGIKVQLGEEPGFWVATLAAVQEYQEQKDKRGRKTKGHS